MKTKYLFPIISIGPPFGYEMDFTFALDRVIKHLPRENCKTILSRHHFFKGKKIKQTETEIEFDGKEWNNKDKSIYKVKSIFKNALEWNRSNQTEYIETHFEIISDHYFSNIDKFQHIYYTTYYGNGKIFLSDNSMKYGAPRTTQQIKEFEEWCEGYPDCNISRKIGLDESILIINPFSTKAKVKITFLSKDKFYKNFTINPFSSHRIPISNALPKNIGEWSGQIFVSGRHRLVIFFLKHNLYDSSIITSLEHSEHFRGETTHYDLDFYLKQIKRKSLKFFKL